jgi:gamma-glutamylcyclotransferase (GGCT)/AIG2-like uncharacterized protein YtfP
MTLRLFVYGTLRSDLPAHLVPPAATAARAMLHGQGRLEGRASMLGGLVAPAWYPGLIEDAPGRVQGEVWRLPGASVLSRLDWYEGPDYVRRIRRTRLHTGRLLVAHVYLYVRDAAGLPVIPTGDFADWLAKPRDPRDDRSP